MRKKPATPTTTNSMRFHGIGAPATRGRPSGTRSLFAARRARKRAIQYSGLRESSGAIYVFPPFTLPGGDRRNPMNGQSFVEAQMVMSGSSCTTTSSYVPPT